MKTQTFIDQARRDASILDCLQRARYALAIHNGMTIIGDDVERSEWKLDFDAEIREIDAIMEMLGVDFSEPLRPPKPMDSDE
ncbi:hypothetical protein [Paraburkholderia caribensis]|uniref:hypothetical protein n=1 Tax=Paraburkholderia caribensis TaxID=75105 RepID=UPI0015905F0F|nr:hypothetical protein [Paraburkholderia caribensis]MCO4879033.1 hypothetical protein [Paraburkholderia caribensis]